MKVKLGKYLTKKNRRINVVIDKYDTWGLDHTLALIILPSLIQLKHTKHGVPGDFAEVGGEDYVSQQSFDFYMETHSWAFDEKVKEWDEILDKMIWSFHEIAKDEYVDQYHHGKAKYEFVKTNTQFPNPTTGKMEDTFEMVDRNPDEHWYDMVGHRLHEERIQEGLNLFGKYFRNLWD
jgi:hypothetical protein